MLKKENRKVKKATNTHWVLPKMRNYTQDVELEILDTHPSYNSFLIKVVKGKRWPSGTKALYHQGMRQKKGANN